MLFTKLYVLQNPSKSNASFLITYEDSVHPWYLKVDIKRNCQKTWDLSNNDNNYNAQSIIYNKSSRLAGDRAGCLGSRMKKKSLWCRCDEYKSSSSRLTYLVCSYGGLVVARNKNNQYAVFKDIFLL